MKGQTKEAAHEEAASAKPSVFDGSMLENSVSSLVGRTSMLHVVPEGHSTVGESEDSGVLEPGTIILPSGDKVTIDGSIFDESKVVVDPINDSSHTPDRVVFGAKSAPTTPADHKKMLDMEDMDSPLSMDDDDDITSSGPGIPGSAASLTPPMSPVRGFQDFVTPLSGRRAATDLHAEKLDSLMLPGLPLLPKPVPYTRRRSRSVGDENENVETDPKDLVMVADVVRDMLFPETDHDHPHKDMDAALKNGKKSNIVVNRNLYRAHRQMRLAVLDASKRFEEQQAEHARDVILAQREEAEGKTDPNTLGMIQAGLVMRHGQNKQVSSEAIRSALRENKVQQQALVEKATRRGGRGRRSRKKTISDMSAMMNSMGQDELLSIAVSAAKDPGPLEESKVTVAGLEPDVPEVVHTGNNASMPDLPDMSEEGILRGATVPGEFRKTNDPFSQQGRYGLAPWNP